MMANCPAKLTALFKGLGQEDAQALVSALEDIGKQEPTSDLFQAYQKMKTKLDRMIAMEELAIAQSIQKGAALHDTVFTKALEVHKGDYVAAFNAVITGDYGLGQGLSKTVMNSRKARQREFEGVFYGAIASKPDLKLLLSQGVIEHQGVKYDLQLEIAKEVFEIHPHTFSGGELPAVSKFEGTPHGQQLRELAQAFIDTNNAILQRYNDYGVPVKEDPNYSLPTRHDPLKIKGVTPDEWADFIFDKLDYEKTFGADKSPYDARKFLVKLHQNFQKLAIPTSITKMIKDNDFENIAYTLTKERTLYFKDGEAWTNYHKRFGDNEGSVVTALHNHMVKASNDIGNVDVFGISPSRTLFGKEHGVLGKLLKDTGLLEILDSDRVELKPKPEMPAEIVKLQDGIDSQSAHNILKAPDSHFTVKLGDVSYTMSVRDLLQGIDLPASQQKLLFAPSQLAKHQRPNEAMMRGYTTAIKNIAGKWFEKSKDELAKSFPSELGDSISKMEVIDRFHQYLKDKSTLHSTVKALTDDFEKQVLAKEATYQEYAQAHKQALAEWEIETQYALAEKDARLSEAYSLLGTREEELKALGEAFADNGSISHNYGIMSGKYSGIENEAVARFGANIRSAVQSAKLMTAVITNLADAPQAIKTLEYRGFSKAGLWEGVSTDGGKYDPIEFAYNLLGAKADLSEKQLFLRSIGAGLDSVGDSMGGDLAQESLVHPWLQKINTFSNQAGLMERWNSAMKQGITWSVYHTLGEIAGKTFEDVPPILKHTLRRFDIDGLDWEVLRQFTTRVKDSTVIDYNGLIEASRNDELLATRLRGRVAELLGDQPSIKQYLLNLQTKYSAMVADTVDMGSFSPTDFDKAWVFKKTPAWFRKATGLVKDVPLLKHLSGFNEGLQSGYFAGKQGNLWREILRSTIWQLKTFTQGMANRGFAEDALHFKTAKGTFASGATAYLAAMAVLGTAAVHIRAASKGEGRPDMSKPANQLRVVSMGIAGPFYVDLIMEMCHGSTLIDATKVFAPAGSYPISMLAQLGQAAGDASQGKSTNDEWEKIALESYRMLPFNNFIYTRAITDELILNNIRRSIDGGEGLAKEEKRKEELYGSLPWFGN